MIDELLESNPEFRGICLVCKGPLSDGCGCEDNAEHVAKKASELLLESAKPFDEACMLVREMEIELEHLREMEDIAERSIYILKQFRDTDGDFKGWHEKYRPTIELAEKLFSDIDPDDSTLGF